MDGWRRRGARCRRRGRRRRRGGVSDERAAARPAPAAGAADAGLDARAAAAPGGLPPALRGRLHPAAAALGRLGRARRPRGRQTGLHRRGRGRGGGRQPAAAAGARGPLGDAARRTRAHGAATADAALLPRRGGRRRRRDDGRGLRSARSPLAAGRALRAVAADAGDHPGGRDASRLRPRRRGPPARPRRQADGADRVAEHAAQPDQAGALRASRLARSRGYREAMRPVEAAVMAEAKRRAGRRATARPGVATMLAQTPATRTARR